MHAKKKQPCLVNFLEYKKFNVDPSVFSDLQQGCEDCHNFKKVNFQILLYYKFVYIFHGMKKKYVLFILFCCYLLKIQVLFN